MKSILSAFILVLAFVSASFADGHGDGHPILTPLEPESMNGAYTGMLIGAPAFQKNSGLDPKTFELMSLTASVGMKCEYCILAHTAQAKAAGATDEEIKTAVMIAGLVAINSTVLYGNQFDLEALRKMMGQ